MSCESEASDPHAEQRQRQGEWLEKLRSRKEELESQGVRGFDLMDAMTTLSLEHKVATYHNQCLKCWHDTRNCICCQLAPLKRVTATPYQVKLIIWMHHKEYLCAGNSAKLLLQLLPDDTELFICGKAGEFERLQTEIDLDPCHCAILWPGKAAFSVQEFLTQQTPDSSAIRAAATPTTTMTTIRFVVLDGTYTQARNMYKSLRKRLGENRMPCTVQLNPTTASVFHRAKKNYAKAHDRQHADEARRISTAEACGLLLTELSGDGGSQNNLQCKIIEAVEINNRALAFERGDLSNTTA